MGLVGLFIISRISEAWQRGMSTERAVAHGIKTTAGTVIAAALVMVLVFAVFATESSLDLKQLGVCLSVAILIDATIIRGILLPATMKLLGKWKLVPAPLAAMAARARTRRRLQAGPRAAPQSRPVPQPAGA